MTEMKTQSATIYCQKTRKRPYKKSTKGCKNCKIRKIKARFCRVGGMHVTLIEMKCDEKRPVCGNCTKRYIGLSHCEYVGSDEESTAESVSSSNSRRREILPLPRSPTILPLSLGQSDTLQLRLMYHYTKSTCGRHIISTVPILPVSLWEVEIPQIAFSSELVLNALMGLSALHLLSMNLQDSSLALASGRFLNKALQQHRIAVESTNYPQPEALIIAAVLIAHHNWLAASTKAYQESYKVDLGTYRMCQGITALVDKFSPWLLETPQDSCANVNNEIEYLLFPKFLENALDDLETLLQTLKEECASQNVKDSYEHAGDLLRITYSRIAHGLFGKPPIEQYITGFMPKASPLFIKHLGDNEPLAMAMFARNVALLAIFPDASAWWLHGAGQCKMADTTVHGICGLMPPESLWMMNWPLRIVSGDITLEA